MNVLTGRGNGNPSTSVVAHLGGPRSNSSATFFGTPTDATSYVVGHLDDAIALLQREVSLERLVVRHGVALTSKAGKLTGTCPFHTGNGKPGIVTIDAKANTWTCSKCKVNQATVVEWMMKAEGISRRHAVELLQADSGTSMGSKTVKVSTTKKLADVLDGAADDAHLFEQVVGYYHDVLTRNVKALDWLKGHGITGEAVERFRVGMADRTLGYRLPKANRKGGAEVRGRLQRLGIYRDTGHEVLRGCVTMPLYAATGAIVGMYGRRMDTRGVEEPDLRTGTKGLFNSEAFTASRAIVLCSNPFDALIMWCCGTRNVTAIHGPSGDLDELLDAIGRHGTTRVTLAFPRTDEGETASALVVDAVKGVEVFRVLFPTGMDVHEFVSWSSAEGLVGIIRDAEWIGGVKPRATAPAPARIVVEGSPESATSTASPRADES